MGCVQELLVTLLPLLHLQLIEEERKCDGCGLNETNRIRWPLPLKIHQLKSLQFSSIKNILTGLLVRRILNFVKYVYKINSQLL